jgi:hypothetical protein
MKRDSVPHFLLVLGVLAVAGLIIWPGCATPPLPATRTPLSRLRPADFKYEPGSTQPRPSRLELEARLGQPDEYFEDLHVAAYRLNQVKRKRLWLLFFVLPVGTSSDPDQIEVGFVEYNDTGLVRRMTVQKVPDWPNRPFGSDQRRFWSAAARWLQEPDPQPKARK